jgi:hypothetical protein
MCAASYAAGVAVAQENADDAEMGQPPHVVPQLAWILPAEGARRQREMDGTGLESRAVPPAVHVRELLRVARLEAPTPRIDPVREYPDNRAHGMEVEVAPDVRVLETGPQQQHRRVQRSARHHHGAGAHREPKPLPVGPAHAPLHTNRPPLLYENPFDVALGHEARPTTGRVRQIGPGRGVLRPVPAAIPAIAALESLAAVGDVPRDRLDVPLVGP